MLEQFEIDSWSGPHPPEIRARAQASLEPGRSAFFPRLAFRLANSETEFLDASLTDGKAKNISLDWSNGKLQGTSATGEKAFAAGGGDDRAVRRAGATRFVTDLLPNYAGVERARTSYRPVEVEGRGYSAMESG